MGVHAFLPRIIYIATGLIRVQIAYIRVWGAPFRTAGREEKGRSHLVGARRRRRRGGGRRRGREREREREREFFPFRFDSNFEIDWVEGERPAGSIAATRSGRHGSSVLLFF